ncbi:hypothetical protein COY52_06980 [Candidatus Desantisbacteria bacterium CG_4_10_14_0_8_um_filter_48_22]|uniref:Predicted DNA-binding protein ribbon-helix-helix domain-containing protein n=1 Tax=Candidatus Desantisbacteria bacterium CG_4_10_14_0_8_um_filter_48_22 TaxID=1974543 RepID=A0A2M7SA72_9BACT|nr:MAG: hypothetical protein AUJ67_04910 [Candidatus Desantisbacteria bacterium CG1_02_49_89]PIZ16447.1 MAG: hypothetical protein COY52_06980 [Candidatus Desantisbacteria bacterium CG_4_10_14_0_8_um_filter_48_22]
MAKVKTAISIKEDLLEEMDSIARKRRMPRSNLFEKAIEDFLERQKNKQIVNQLNAVYSTPPTAKEKKLLRIITEQSRKIAEGEW